MIVTITPLPAATERGTATHAEAYTNTDTEINAHEITTKRGHVLQLRGLQQTQGHLLKAVSFRVGAFERETESGTERETESGTETEGEATRLTRLEDTSQPVEDRAASVGWWTHTAHSLSTPRHSVVVNLGQQPATQRLEVKLDFEV